MAAAAPSYMSYFGLGWNIRETQDHANLYWAVSWVWDGSEIVDEIADARMRGLPAIVHTEFAFFEGSGVYANACPYKLRPDAAVRWDTFAQALAAEGLLDTVAAFYPVDEPDGCALAPADVLTVLQVIRSHPLTAGKPIAAIFTCDVAQRYGGLYKYSGQHVYGDVLRAYDWVGVDCYGTANLFRDAAWSTKTFDFRCWCVRTIPGPSYYDNFKAQLNLAAQRLILVPQGFISGASDGLPDDPQLFADVANADTAVVLMAPFTWFDQPFHPGVRSQPALAQSWRGIGLAIATTNVPKSSPLLLAPVAPRLAVAASDIQHFSVYDLTCNATTDILCAVQLDWYAGNQAVGTQLFVRLNDGAPVFVGCGTPISSIDIPWLVAGNRYTFDLYQGGTCTADMPAGSMPVASLTLSL